MLNRRHLRIKALQGLYMFLVSDEKNVRKIELELLKSTEKINDLYHQILSIYGELLHQANLQIDRNKQKRLPTVLDLNPNLAFIQNQVLHFITSNPLLVKYCFEKKIQWLNDQDIIRKLFKTLVESDFYNAYMDIPGKPSFESDKILILNILENIIASSDIIEQTIDEKNLFWTDDLTFVYSKISQNIDKITPSSSPQDLIFQNVFKDEDDRQFLIDLLRKAIANLNTYENMIKDKAEHWEYERIALIDRILLILGITELIHFPSIPVKVTLNEYIDLAKEYSTDKSNIFINGLLDKIVQDLQKQGKIQKVGRGLIDKK